MGMATYPGYQGYPTMGYPYQGPPSGYGPPPQMVTSVCRHKKNETFFFTIFSSEFLNFSFDFQMSSGAYSLGMDDSRSSSRNARNRTPPAGNLIL